MRGACFVAGLQTPRHQEGQRWRGKETSHAAISTGINPCLESSVFGLSVLTRLSDLGHKPRALSNFIRRRIYRHGLVNGIREDLRHAMTVK
ncbi:hypothetical protein MY1884_007490, partial [Beauveria asiatica]